MAIDHVSSVLGGHLRLRANGGYVIPNEETVFDWEWETLTILDACRYDIFEEVHDFQGEVEKRLSQAPNTKAWFNENFVGADDELLSDVVYITGNPTASSQHINRDRFAHLEEVFRYGWDEDIRTVPPDVMTDVALKLREEYPGKKFVIHYMQPHVPFYAADDYSPEKYTPDYVRREDADVSASEEEIEKIKNASDNLNMFNHPFDCLKSEKASKEEVVNAYRDTLEAGIEEVHRLIKYWDGELVISSDHGNGYGEHGVYGHPPWGKTWSTLEVPWCPVSGKGVETPEEVTSTEIGRETVDTSIDEQLQALGYR